MGKSNNAKGKRADLEVGEKKKVEELASKVFKILFVNANVQDGLQSCLKLIGESFNVSRMYIFENSRDGKYCSNTFEWCNKGIKPEIENLQNLSYEEDLGTEYYNLIKNERLVYVPNIKKLSKKPKEILESQNIKSMLHHAIYDGDEFMGFVGFDECTEQEHSWVSEHKDILIFFSKVISVFFIKKKKSDFLKEKLELIENFIEKRTNGVFIVNKKTQEVTYVNENLAKDKFKDELIQIALNIYLDKDYDKKEFEVTKKIVHKSSFSAFTFKSIGQNRAFMVEVRNVIRYGKQSNVFYFTEITKVIRLRNELENTIELTKQSRKAKKRFIALLANDLKEPITEIIETAKEDSEKTDDDFIKEKFLKIKSITTHLSNLVNDVLDMKKIENGAFLLQDNRFDLKKEIEKILAVIRNAAKRKNQTFSEEIFIEHNGFEGDLKKINRVLYNILINAVTYTAKGGQIALKIKELKNNKSEYSNIEITVTDNGVGISEKKLQEVFDLEKSKCALKMGGLGLILAKYTLNAIDGSLDIASKIGEGTEVVIRYSLKILTLPECLKENIPYKVTTEERFGTLNAMQKEAINSPNDLKVSNKSYLSQEEMIARLKGLSVLVAEDNNINKLVLKRILTRVGIKATVCENGKVALNKFLKSADGKYDLILMDIQMPIMDGYVATKEIRKSSHPQSKSIPILALSANIFLDDIEISKNVGMNAHLAKPIDAESLYKKIYEYTYLEDNKSEGEL